MLKSEVLEIIANGENSRIEFKRDDMHPESLAKEVVALANLQGGRILIGVEDDGTIVGVEQRDKGTLEEWVMTIVREKVHPMIIPDYEEVVVDDKRVAIIGITLGVSKPYVVRHKGNETVYVRSGSASQRASGDEIISLAETGRLLHVEALPISGTSPWHLLTLPG